MIRPVEGAPPLNAVIVTLGLLVLLQAFAGMVWGGNPRSFPPAFSIKGFKVGGHTVLFSPFDLFTVLVVARADGRAASLLFRRTDLGLRMRAAAFAPRSRGCSACASARMLTLGLGARLAGGLAGRPARRARRSSSRPTNFDAVLVFGFTAAVLGGLDSPPGALVGGAAARARAELRVRLRWAPRWSRSARW